MTQTDMENTNSLLSVKKLVKHFDISGGLLDQLAIENGRIIRKETTVKALNGVSFSIIPRETLLWVRAAAENRPWQEQSSASIRRTAAKYTIVRTESIT